MKLLSFRHGDRTSFGAIDDRGVSDLGAAGQVTLRAAIEAVGLEGLERRAREATQFLAPDQITFLPPVTDPSKIICVGMNYAAHNREMGAPVPSFPSLFVRFPQSQVGQGEAIVRPRVSSAFDFEGELAVVIGKSGRHIAEADALSHVAGYSIFAENSVRDWQSRVTQVTAGKNFEGSGAFGPWLVTTDEIPDPSTLVLTTRLNGDQVQHSGVDDLIFSIPVLIAHISAFTTLYPGDVIATGTPSGVGAARKPPLWLKPGDVLEVEISGIGVLRNPVIDEKE